MVSNARRIGVFRMVTILVAACAPLMAACELGETTVPQTEPRLVVHAVLNPSVSEQVILVEQSLTGRVDSGLRRYTPYDPIVATGGDPVSNADVRLFADDDTAGVRAVEARVGLRASGRYVVATSVLDVRPGKRYRLRIRTEDGREVTGETTIPAAPPDWRPDAVLRDPIVFNRTTDTLRLAWAGFTGARTYAVRVETPYGPWALFTDSTRVSLSGSLRNFLAEGLPSVFLPGFDQYVSVTAVDRNFYDYNRSGNDPWGGTGLISSVQGGIGMFGSMLIVALHPISVLEQLRFPLDGRWTGTSELGAVDMSIWIDAGGAALYSVSGRLEDGMGRYILGTQQGQTVRLAFLAGASRSDTLALFTGQLAGDSIVGESDPTYRGRVPRVWRRVAR